MLCRHPGWSGPWSATVVLLLFGLQARLWAIDDIQPATEVGWNGHLVLGAWTSLSVHREIPEAGSYRVDVTATDPDGNLATFTGPEATLSPGPQRLSGRFLLGRADGVITARIMRDGELWAELSVPQVDGLQVRQFRHTQSERLYVTVGLPEKVQGLLAPSASGRPTVIAYPDTASLPEDDRAYDGVAGLFLAGTNLPAESQSAAIERWVLRGGQLLISVGLKPNEFRESSLIQRLPVTVDPEPQSVRDLTPLESYAGKTVRILPAGKPIPLPKFSFRAGRSLTGSRNDTALIQVPFGFGSVTLLGLDLTQAPLRDWEGLRELLRRITATGELSEQGVGRNQQLASTGITEISSQVSASLEHFGSVSRTSPWWILVGLLAVIILIGPLDYWIVAKLTKRPLVTWITFPCLLALSAGAAVWAAGTTNGRDWLINQLDLVDIDTETGYARGTHLSGIYSPDSTTVPVQFQPLWTNWAQPKDKTPKTMLGWFGLSEAAFGGMYRLGARGLQLSEARYSLVPTQGEIQHLPLAQWSTASLSANVDAQLPNLVDAQLTSKAAGRLAGTVSHRLPGPLTDWFLTYAGRIYRLPEKDQPENVLPLAPQQVFRVDQPSVLQRELRGYLTRTTAREVRQSKDRTSVSIVVQQASYDSLSQDLQRILPILTFHEAIGGGTYTGLANDMLSQHDLSPLLDLDRACLFGYLDQSAAELTIAEQASPEIKRTTLVRIILPVDRSKQTIRELPKKDMP